MCFFFNGVFSQSERRKTKYQKREGRRGEKKINKFHAEAKMEMSKRG